MIGICIVKVVLLFVWCNGLVFGFIYLWWLLDIEKLIVRFFL